MYLKGNGTAAAVAAGLGGFIKLGESWGQGRNVYLCCELYGICM